MTELTCKVNGCEIKTEIEELKKENEELMNALEKSMPLKLANQLKKENEELKERLRIESQSLHEQCEIVSKQVEQIEKMKCCGNCTKKYCHSNNAYYNYCINNNKCKWELKE